MRKVKTENESTPLTGAPAALKRLETEELKCYQAKELFEARLSELAEPPLNAPEEMREAWKACKAGLESDLLFAFKRWDVARKALMEYDKSVKAERREGEKVLVSEAREWLAQMQLTLALGVEQALLSASQAAALCNEAETFAGEIGPIVREAMATSLRAATREGAVPAWAA
jgi:hypothetical protein